MLPRKKQQKVGIFGKNANLYLKSVAMESLAQGAFGVIQGLYIMSLGLDERTLGIIISARMLAAAFASIPAGILSDRRGRRPVLIAGGIFTTLGYLGMALSSSALSMIIFSCVVGISQACRETSGAPLLAESSTLQNRARLFGINFSLSNFVNMGGSLLGGALPRQFGWLGQITAFRLSLAIFAIVTFLGVFPTLRIREEFGRLKDDKKKEKTVSTLAIAKREIMSLLGTMKNKDVLNLLVYKIFIGFGAGLVVPFFNIFLSGKLNIDIAIVGLILSFNHGATALAGLVTPYLSKRFGMIKTVVGTQLLSIPFLLLIALPPNIYLVSIALFMRSALMNMSNPVSSNFSMEIVATNERGKVSSLMRISDNLARSLSAVAAGYIMVRWNYEIPYFLTAILYFFASMLYWRAFKDRK